MNDKKGIVVLGSGGHAEVLVEALMRSGRRVRGLTDPDKKKWGSKIFDAEVLGDDSVLSRFTKDEVELVNGLGSINDATLKQRVAVFEKFSSAGFVFATVVHPAAIIADGVSLAEGVQILAGANIRPFTNIGKNSIVNTGAILDHGCQVGDHVHIAPGAVLSGAVRLGKGSHIGTGAVIIQGISVGADSIVGAGSVVIRDVEPQSIVVGNPAKRVDA